MAAHCIGMVLDVLCARIRGHDFSSSVTVAEEVAEVVVWLSQRSAAEVNEYREKTILRIEAFARELRRSGKSADWANAKDPNLRKAADGVNGPLLVSCGVFCLALYFVMWMCACQERLAKYIKFHDCACIDMFRRGAPLLGKLVCSGNGKRFTAEEYTEPDLDKLVKGLEKRLVACRIACSMLYVYALCAGTVRCSRV